MQLSLTLTSVLALVLSAAAMPLKRSVWAPPVTAPDSQTHWVVGDTVTVTWDTAHPPVQITNSKGQLVLGYLEGDSDNEHLDLKNPLAENFSLYDGKVKFVVPDVESRDNYIVVLIGDSGNASPPFTISA